MLEIVKDQSSMLLYKFYTIWTRQWPKDIKIFSSTYILYRYIKA